MKRLLTICLLLVCSAAFAGEDAGLAGYAYSLINGSRGLNITANGAVNNGGFGAGGGFGNTRATSYFFDYQGRVLTTEICNASYSAILGGSRNTITNATLGWNGIFCGASNQISGSLPQYSVVLGGQNNTNSGLRGISVGGSTNNLTGQDSAQIGAVNGTISGAHAIGYGQRPIASIPGQHAHAVAGTDPGSGFTFQHSQVLAWKLTTDATATRLTTSGAADASGNRWTIASGTSYVGQVYVSGIATDSTRASVGYVIDFKAQRVNSTVTVATGSTMIIEDAPLTGCSAEVLADSTNGAFYVSVVGSTTTNMRWTTCAKYMEVNQP
jgi:hypothetical protein